MSSFALFIATILASSGVVYPKGVLEILVEEKIRQMKSELKSELLSTVKETMQCSCQTDWLVYGGHRYFISESKKRWHDAQEDCKRRNSNLVKIDNSAENQWLKTVLKENTWIGANDLKVRGRYTWVSDGSSVGFSNWNRYEPSHASEHCVHMWRAYRYNWNDLHCTAKLAYVCERH